MLRTTLFVCAMVVGFGAALERSSTDLLAAGAPPVYMRSTGTYIDFPAFDDYFTTYGGYRYAQFTPLQHYVNFKSTYVEGLPVFGTKGMYPAPPPSFAEYHPYAPVTIPPHGWIQIAPNRW